MKITAIKRQVKKQDRYSVFVDESYLFSLGEGQLVESGLHTGQELTETQAQNYKKISDNGKIFDKVLNYLSYRQRTVWELRDYLRRKEASEDQTEFVIEKCVRLNLVDDEKFAKAWVQSRRLGKPTSQRKLRSELAAKRVSGTIIDSVLSDDRNESDELDILKNLAIKKRNRYPDDTKLMQYLARQGFNYGDIKQVLDNLDDDS